MAERRALILAALLAATPVAAQDRAPTQRFDKPLDAPELPGTLLPQGEVPKADDVPTVENGRTPDFAFGAYQRGYYLTALQLALPRAESGDPAAQTLIAEIYALGLGVGRDIPKAIQWYRFAAEGGNREAQFAYAIRLLRGEGLPRDEKAGEDFMRRAADAGHPRASFNLAQILTARRPTYAGFAEALPYYQTAAEGGVPDAQYALSTIHADAKGVPVNNAPLALSWLRRAAAGGLDTAQVELGTWLANGRGGKADPQSAFGWFARAARQGNVLAQNRLARMYDSGFGTKPNPILAGAWHIVARRAGFADAAMDTRFAALSDIDRKRALEAANRLLPRS